MFDRPGFILIVALVTFAPLTAHAFVKAMNHWRNPTGADAVFSFLTLFEIDLLIALIVSVYLASRYDEYEKDNAVEDEYKPPTTEPQEKRTLLDMNKVVYPFQTPKLEIDLETSRMKRFSRTLITQREQGFKIDLREDTWKGSFGGRKNYVRVRDVRMAGAFAKENPELNNSPFVVVDWRVVEAGAQGRLQ